MQQLALKIKQGDERAFRVFFDGTHHIMLRYLKQVLYNNVYLDDIIQEAYLKVWQNREQIDPERPLENWLFVILRNVTVNHLEKQTAEQGRINALQQVPESVSTFNYNEGDIHLQQKDGARVYAHVLQSIPSSNARRCFRLHREEGLSYKQIAVIEGLAVKTVEGHISAVLKQFRKIDYFTHCIIFTFLPFL